MFLPISAIFQVASDNQLNAARLLVDDNEDVYIPPDSLVANTPGGGQYLVAYIELCGDHKIAPKEEQLEIYYEEDRSFIEEPIDEGNEDE